MIIKLFDHGDDVAKLQRDLVRAGYQVEITHIYDDETQSAVMAVQRASGLVVDGIAGPKTRTALLGALNPKHLRDIDLVNAAEKLGVPVACVRAVNEVESRGQGMLPDGRPVILFERHEFYEQLQEHGKDPAPLAIAYPNIVSKKPGGYQGGAAEYTRLASAKLIDAIAAQESASWGAFQIMGYHWKALGYKSIDDFVAYMTRSEADQLDAFVRFILDDPTLHAALKARKWAKFAEIYNGPKYAINLYDKKLDRAFKKYAEPLKAAA